MAENKLSDMIKNALDGVRTIADSSTVVGDPIPTNNGTVIIPVSKVSVGFASGGLDYMPKGEKEAAKTAKPASPCFGGGGGTGVSVTPVCFLVISADGNVSMMNINSPAAAASGTAGTINSISSFAEKAPDIIGRIKDLFKKKEPVRDLDDEILESELEELAKEFEEEAAKADEKK
ncbi:MAG: hypothetical protein IJD10_06385 [Clostridia bacterium]|nr:hypothetical protein [Clostridia bacterium]